MEMPAGPDGFAMVGLRERGVAASAAAEGVLEQEEQVHVPIMWCIVSAIYGAMHVYYRNLPADWSWVNTCVCSYCA